MKKLRRERREKTERPKRVRISRDARELEQIFEPKVDLNPFKDIEYPDGASLEEGSNVEVKALADTFSGRAKLEAKRFELAADSEFWFSVVFKSREQKEVFLKAMNWLQEGDKYLVGPVLAEISGIDLPDVSLPTPKGINKRTKRLARDLSKEGGEG
jgi:hypothetical protein